MFLTKTVSGCLGMPGENNEHLDWLTTIKKKQQFEKDMHILPNSMRI